MSNKIVKLMCLLLSVSAISGCSYYTHLHNQENLDVDLAKYRSTMQTPATTISPAQYRICDDHFYPCNLTTPINEVVPATLLGKVIDNQPPTSKKYHAQKAHHHHRPLKRTYLCKN